MTEQKDKPEIGAIEKTNRIIKKIGRNKYTRPIALGVAGIGLGFEIWACGGKPTTTTEPSLPSTTTTTQELTTTTTEPTTTTEVLTTTTESTTTTTESESETAKFIGSLLIEDKALVENVTGKIARGITLNKSDPSVTSNLNSAFKHYNLNYNILYVAKSNEGLKMNAVIESRPIQWDTWPENVTFYINYLGGNPSHTYPDQSGVDMATGVIVGAEPIGQDVIVYWQNPLDGKISKGRLITSRQLGLPSSVLGCLNLKVNVQRDYNPNPGNHAATEFRKKHNLDELAKQGDVGIFAFANSTSGWIKDKEGNQIITNIDVQRFDGFDQIDALFK